MKKKAKSIPASSTIQQEELPEEVNLWLRTSQSKCVLNAKTKAKWAVVTARKENIASSAKDREAKDLGRSILPVSIASTKTTILLKARKIYLRQIILWNRGQISLFLKSGTNLSISSKAMNNF